MDVYVETGAKRVFASALHWPGWSRNGRDEVSALQALLDYAPRYTAALGTLADGLVAPPDASRLAVVERLAGGAATDFGVPAAIPGYDERPPDSDELRFLAAVMAACWAAFDRWAGAATGRELAPAGPRGGGRNLEKVSQHAFEAERSYLGSLGGRAPADGGWPAVRDAFVEALGARARGELPSTGPRGGRRWPARYAARRAAWHLLDHAWEIEDRLRS